MSFLMPKVKTPPMPPPPAPLPEKPSKDSEEAKKRADALRAKIAAMGGRKASILTEPMGLGDEEAPIMRPSLLGRKVA